MMPTKSSKCLSLRILEHTDNFLWPVGCRFSSWVVHRAHETTPTKPIRSIAVSPDFYSLCGFQQIPQIA
jgi:hypothetical protein